MPARGDQHIFLFKAVFEAFRDFHIYSPGGNGKLADASGMKVMSLEGALGADKLVISVHPCGIGGVGATVLTSDEDARRCGMSCWIQHGDSELTHRFQIVSFSGYDLGLCSAKNFLRPK